VDTFSPVPEGGEGGDGYFVSVHLADIEAGANAGHGADPGGGAGGDASIDGGVGLGATQHDEVKTGPAPAVFEMRHQPSFEMQHQQSLELGQQPSFELRNQPSFELRRHLQLPLQLPYRPQHQQQQQQQPPSHEPEHEHKPFQPQPQHEASTDMNSNVADSPILPRERPDSAGTSGSKGSKRGAGCYDVL